MPDAITRTECGEFRRYIGGTLNSINARLGRIDTAVNGNGREGLNVRVAKLEQTATDTRRSGDVFWKIVAVGASLAAVVVAIVK